MPQDLVARANKTLHPPFLDNVHYEGGVAMPPFVYDPPFPPLIPFLLVAPPSLWRERHWFLGCTTLSLIVWGLSAPLVWNTTIDGNPVYYIWWWWTMPPVVYITHLCHSAWTSTKHCIDNKSNTEESKFLLQNLMTAPPKMYWRVTNYHRVEGRLGHDESDYQEVTSIKTTLVQVTSPCAPVHAVSGPDRVCAYLKPDVNCAGIYLCCRGSIHQTDVLRRIFHTEQDR